MELGRAVGATTILVLTGHGEQERARAEPNADRVAADLAGAAAIIREVLLGEGT
jgi:phosphoglycolate phosphatase-like HAD superfamily hydrolase